MRKKGIQLGEAFGAVLALTLVAVLVIVSIYIFSNLQTTMSVAGTTGTAINESVTSSPSAGLNATLAAGSYTSGACGTITNVYNGTGGNVIALANFTQTNCAVVNASSMVLFNTTLRFSYPYTYTASTSSSNASGAMITQFATYPVLIGLVGTIIFLALVIGTLVGAFAFGGRKGM